MNFAAQLIYAKFVNDSGSPAHQTPRNFNDIEEYDPFWQRWETVESQCGREFQTSACQSPIESERCAGSETVMSETITSVRDRVAFPLSSPSHPELLPYQEHLIPAPNTRETSKPAVICQRLREAVLNTAREERMKTPRTSTAPGPQPARVQAGASEMEWVPPAHKPPDLSSVATPSKESSLLSSLPPSLQLTVSPENTAILPLLQALVYLLLKLFLTFILFFLPRAQQRRASTKPDCSFHSGPCLKDGHVVNGRTGRRSTLICPERLKDFGAEEYLNGDVKVFETRVTEAPEVQLTSTPKPSTKKGTESESASKPASESLRFEDISAAAFQLQKSGIQKIPCSV